MKKINKKEKFNIKEYFNRMIKLFRKYFSTNILFLTYVITSIVIGFLLRLLTLGTVSDFRALVCDFIMVIVLGSFGYLIKPKHQFKYFFVLSIIYTTACVINHIYYTFYMSFASVSLLSTLTFLGAVSDSVTTKLKLVYFIYILAPIIMLIVNKLLTKKNYYYEVGKDEKGKLSEKLKETDNISEFLKKNSDAWTIKDDKIQFTNLNRMTEYYNLLNKLTD